MNITYPGGKSGSGVYQQYINLIPPHDIYIETHLGGGGIMRRKLPAKKNIGIDIDSKVIEMWSSVKEPSAEIYQQDAIEFLKNHNFTGKEFIYCDPPYLRETRERSRKLYKYEYTIEQHIRLLEIIRKIPAMVMISGYESELYKEKLHDWRTHSFQAKTHKNTAIEWIWMNYPKPAALHDYRYLGNNFRERDRVKYAAKAWKIKIEKMSILQRQVLASILHTYI